MHRVNKRPFNVLSSGSPYLAKLRGLRSKEVAEVLDFEIRDMVKILDEQEKEPRWPMLLRNAPANCRTEKERRNFLLNTMFTVLSEYMGHPECLQSTYDVGAEAILCASRRTKALGIM